MRQVWFPDSLDDAVDEVEKRELVLLRALQVGEGHKLGSANGSMAHTFANGAAHQSSTLPPHLV